MIKNRRRYRGAQEQDFAASGRDQTGEGLRQGDRGTAGSVAGILRRGRQNSQEQRDLELLAKEMDAKTPWKQVSLTKEEGERIEQIRAQGLTEYQERSLEMKKGAEYYENQINEMKKEIEMENSIIRATRLERLKKDPMVKAQKQAEEIMEAASEEIVGMLADEAKDHIDEEMEEKKEAAQEKAEEAKELEEKLEKIKEKKEDQEELAEAIGELTEQTLQLDGVKTDIQEEIKISSIR